MSLVTFVYIQSVISMQCFSIISLTSLASGADDNFPEYQVKCYNFKPLAASDTAESSSNSTHSEQFSDASSRFLSDLTMKVIT